MSPPPFVTRLAELRVFAIVRASSAAAALEIAHALTRGGLRAIEITFTTPGAAEVLARLREELPTTLLGAGTVLDVAALDAARKAGADFAVSPHLDPALVAAARERHLPYLPGVFTPTEALTAWRSGATALKLFPAAQLGPGHLAALRGPFPELPFVPTGGIDASNLAAWLGAGALAVGIGGSLVRGGADAIEANTRQLLAAAEAVARPTRGA